MSPSAAWCTSDNTPVRCAVSGAGAEPRKRLYYRRVLESLEQQLREFRRAIDAPASAGAGAGVAALAGFSGRKAAALEEDSMAAEISTEGGSSSGVGTGEGVSEGDLEAARGEEAVAAYVRRCRCAQLRLCACFVSTGA